MQETVESLRKNIFSVDAENFTAVCLEVFRFQYEHNGLYQKYCNLVKKSPATVADCNEIPFLPISFFKHKQVRTTDFQPQAVFESSGTTGSTTSRHYVKDLNIYEESFLRAFEKFYGKPNKYCILGLLPSYLERKSSSLVYMVNRLIELSGNGKSGFYLYNFGDLASVLKENALNGTETILIGVTYALIDFAEEFPMDLSRVIVMETGGMKGRKKEMLREEVHTILKKQWKLESVHSEYGMTELLSQAYAQGNGRFNTPPWLKVLCREDDDPFAVSQPGQPARGPANIIDLANLYSCSFLAVEDLVKCYEDGSFEVAGRMDHTDMRGCNLLFANE